MDRIVIMHPDGMAAVDVLERIVSGRTKTHQLHELLAWNWKAARERAERTAA